MLSYISLAAQYIEGASRTARNNGLRLKGESTALETLFETVVFILYVLPVAVGAIDLLRIENLLSRGPCQCKCQFVRHCFDSREDARTDRYAKESCLFGDSVRDANRSRCVAQFLDDLLRVGGRDFHPKKRNKSDSRGDRDGQTDARIPGINDARDAKSHRGSATWEGEGSGTSSGSKNGDGTHLRKGGQRDQTATRFKHISRSTAQYMAAVNATVATLRTSPLSTSWQHLIEMEDRARSLSRLAFSATAPARHNKNNDRKVKLSFSNVRSIWKTEVTRGIYEDEGKGRLGGVPSMSGVVACRNAIIAMLMPGAVMGSVKVGRKAAVQSYRRKRSNSGEGAGVGIELTIGAVKADGKTNEDRGSGAASPLALVVDKGSWQELPEDTLDDNADADHESSSGGDAALWTDVPESKRGQAINVAVVPKLRIPTRCDVNNRVERINTPRSLKSSSTVSGGMLFRGRSRMPEAKKAEIKKANTEAKKERLDALVARLAALGLNLKRSDPSAVPAQGGSAISLKSLSKYISSTGGGDLEWAVQFVKEKRGVV